MSASVTDKLRRGAPAFSTTLVADKSAGAASATLSSPTGIPTDTGVDFTIGRVDLNGNKTPALKAVYKATLSGSTISNLTLVEGIDQLHKAGTPVEITFTAATWNDMVTWGLVHHNQDGTLNAAAAATIASLIPSAAITNTQLAGNIAFAKLLSTIFSGQVSSQANAGTAGGTMYYINLGGIKLLWGQTAANVAASTGPSFTIVFPAAFFTTVQSGTASSNNINTVSNQSINLDNVTPAGCNVFMWAASTTAGEKVGFLIVGT